MAPYTSGEHAAAQPLRGSGPRLGTRRSVSRRVRRHREGSDRAGRRRVTGGLAWAAADGPCGRLRQGGGVRRGGQRARGPRPSRGRRGSRAMATCDPAASHTVLRGLARRPPSLLSRLHDRMHSRRPGGAASRPDLGERYEPSRHATRRSYDACCSCSAHRERAGRHDSGRRPRLASGFRGDDPRPRTRGADTGLAAAPGRRRSGHRIGGHPRGAWYRERRHRPVDGPAGLHQAVRPARRTAQGKLPTARKGMDTPAETRAGAKGTTGTGGCFGPFPVPGSRLRPARLHQQGVSPCPCTVLPTRRAASP